MGRHRQPAPRPLARALTRTLAWLGLVGLIGSAALASCALPGTQDPRVDPTPVPSSGTPAGTPAASTTPAGTPTAGGADVATAAAGAAADWFRTTDTGYTARVTPGPYVEYAQDGATYTAKIACPGGAIQDSGWSGLCTASSRGPMSLVVAVRVGPDLQSDTYATDVDTAAYCGDDETPGWAIRILQKAGPDYCFMTLEDG